MPEVRDYNVNTASDIDDMIFAGCDETVVSER